MIFCPNCGIKTSANGTFCGNCGYNLKSFNTTYLSTQIDKDPQIELNDSKQWNYDTHRIAIALGWIPFFYASSCVF